MRNRDIFNMYQRDIFIDTLYHFAKKDNKIILITNDQGAVALDNYREKLPKQFINAGISEQNIIGVAAGMAKEGYNCFVYSIASFIINRTIEQIKIDLCSMKLPVKIFGVGCGYSYAVDGPTHHATEDISFLNPIPGMTIYSPSDSFSVHKIVEFLIKSKLPTYVRLDREICPQIYNKNNFNLKKGYSIIKKGKKICIITTGKMVSTAKIIADKLSNYQIGIIDLFAVKPLNNDIVKDLLKYKKIFSLEEHNQTGGIGSILSDLIVEKNLDVRLKKLALKENLIFGYGSRDLLQERNSLDITSVIKTIKKNV